MLIVKQLIFILWIGVIAGSNPCYFGRGVKQRIGDLTGDNINFIAFGNRNDHIRVFNAGVNTHLDDSRCQLQYEYPVYPVALSERHH